MTTALARTDAQEQINILANTGNLAEAKALAVADGERTLGEFPQYAGTFVASTLVQVRKRLRSKGGVGFERGDWALAGKEVFIAPKYDTAHYRATREHRWLDVEHRSLYSVRLGVHFAVEASELL